jgi:hypothetical protein
LRGINNLQNPTVEDQLDKVGGQNAGAVFRGGQLER